MTALRASLANLHVVRRRGLNDDSPWVKVETDALMDWEIVECHVAETRLCSVLDELNAQTARMIENKRLREEASARYFAEQERKKLHELAAKHGLKIVDPSKEE